MEATSNANRDDFLKALSNYSECVRPFLRTAQDRYVASYYMIEDQPFNFSEYCKSEREAALTAKAQVKAAYNL